MASALEATAHEMRLFLAQSDNACGGRDVGVERATCEEILRDIRVPCEQNVVKRGERRLCISAALAADHNDFDWR